MSSNYFLETKFLEGPQEKRTFGIPSKTSPIIELISIGIVSEDNREYYAVSKDFNVEVAWNRSEKITDGTSYSPYGEQNTKQNFYLRETVLKKIYYDFLELEILEYNSLKDPKRKAPTSVFNIAHLKDMLKKYGKSNRKIAKEVLCFCRPKAIMVRDCGIQVIEPIDFPIFYSYFAAHSWAVFCCLFGNIKSIPLGFPTYCRSIRQMLDEKAEGLIDKACYDTGNHTIWSLERALQDIKANTAFPHQDSSKEDYAIEDARYFKKLYIFIKRL